jgi:hypothetical protein
MNERKKERKKDLDFSFSKELMILNFVMDGLCFPALTCFTARIHLVENTRFLLG